MLDSHVDPDLDPDTFWDDNEYALAGYVGAPPSAALVASVEAELGYRLPVSYVTLMRSHNGGMPHNTCCPARAGPHGPRITSLWTASWGSDGTSATR